MLGCVSVSLALVALEAMVSAPALLLEAWRSHAHSWHEAHACKHTCTALSASVTWRGRRRLCLMPLCTAACKRHLCRCHLCHPCCRSAVQMTTVFSKHTWSGHGSTQAAKSSHAPHAAVWQRRPHACKASAGLHAHHGHLGLHHARMRTAFGRTRWCSAPTCVSWLQAVVLLTLSTCMGALPAMPAARPKPRPAAPGACAIYVR